MYYSAYRILILCLSNNVSKETVGGYGDKTITCFPNSSNDEGETHAQDSAFTLEHKSVLTPLCVFIHFGLKARSILAHFRLFSSVFK